VDERIVYSYLVGASPSAVSALVGSRVYYVKAPQSVTRPYVVYSLVAGVPQNQLEGTPGIQQYRVQVDAYVDETAGADAARALIQACRDELEWGDRAHCISENFIAFEEDTKLFRASGDFSLWLNR
jgi:hypothetical protein